MAGYWNKILRINLTDASINVEEVNDDLWKFCIGGAGYGAKVLLEEVTAKTKAFDSNNKIIYATGAYNAGNNPGNGKWSTVSISPLTETHCDTAGTGDFGVKLKRAGFDAIVVEGKSDKPVYIYIEDGKAEIKDAKDIWGLDTYSIRDAINKIEGKEDITTAGIGPAGENLVKHACIVVDGHSFAGRGGLGAVMGSKNLKAVAVRGTLRPIIADEKGLKEFAKVKFKEIYDEALKNGFREHGTSLYCTPLEEIGDMPIKNWAGDIWPEGAQKLSAPNYKEALKAKAKPCINCPVGCHRHITIDEGPYKMEGPGPEYETLGMFGTNLLIDDLCAVAKANEICNKLGMDTISAGACVGVAMELYEKGYITEEKAGFKVEWGNPDVLLKMLEDMACRKGYLGELFAEGALNAVKSINGEAVKYVSHVKGMELPAHDARTFWSYAINYATATRGACHMRGPCMDATFGESTPEFDIFAEKTEFFNKEYKAHQAAKSQDSGTFMNSAVICSFVLSSLTYTDLTQMFNMITGWNWTIKDVVKAGERIFMLQRLINLRDGHNRKTDTIPYRMTVEAKEGFRAGKSPTPFNEYLDEYYQIRKWDKDGYPTEECLESVGLLEYIKENKIEI